jgi:O-antigen/teichoic acid export membrane protein
MLLQQAIKNGVFSVATQIVSLVLGLLFAGMTIRYLGNARAGFFVVASMILGWVGVAGMGGFRAAAVQRLAALSAVRDWTTSRALLGTVLTANLLVSLPFALASVAMFPYLFSWSRLGASYRYDAWCVVALGALSFMIDQWSATLRGLYSAHQRFDVVTYTSFAFGLFGNLTRLFVLIQFQNMSSIAVVNVAVSCVWLAVDVIVTRRLLSGWILPVWRRTEIRPLMRFGLWAWSGDTVGAIANNLGSMVTTYYLGSAPLPYIMLPQRIVTQILLFFNSCFYFLFPTLAAKGEAAGNTVLALEDRLRWFVAAASWPAYVAVVLVGPELLTMLAGKEFAEHAYLPLLMFCVFNAINAQNLVYTFCCMAVGRIHPSVVTENAASLLSAASCVVLIPWLGYMGVCWAAMWKVPAVVVMCVWSRRVLGLSRSMRAEWAPYFSPLAAVAVWLCISGLSKLLLGHQGYLALSVSLVCGGVGYLATVWYLETRVFADLKRWATLERAVVMVRNFGANLGWGGVST